MSDLAASLETIDHDVRHPESVTIRMAPRGGELAVLDAHLADHPELVVQVWDWRSEGMDHPLLEDVAFLEHLPHLRRLELSVHDRTVALGGLTAVGELTSLTVRGRAACGSAEIPGLLGRSPELRSLTVATRGSLPRILAQAPLLDELLLVGEEGTIKDIDALRELPEGPRRLVFQSVSVPDLEAVTELTGLEELDITMGRIPDISALAGLPLRRLELCAVQKLAEIDVIRELPQLEELDIDGLSAVQAMPDLSGSEHLTSVQLASMKALRDISGAAAAPGLRSMGIGLCEKLTPQSLAPLQGHATLTRLRVGWEWRRARRDAAMVEMFGTERGLPEPDGGA